MQVHVLLSMYLLVLECKTHGRELHLANHFICYVPFFVTEEGTFGAETFC